VTTGAAAFADIAFNREGIEVTVAGQPLRLSRQEARLLRLLVERGGHILPKSVIEETLYGFGEEVASNSVEVHIHRLRQALRQAGSAVKIETRRGIGYLLDKQA
jgi:DNA-binding response OmpR family regulator